MNQTRRGAVVVTGASSGIGRACALRLSREGFQVFAGVRKAQDGEALRAEAGGSLRPLILEVTQEDSIARAAEEVAGEVGEAGLAGLVNNAGIGVFAPLEYLPLSTLRQIFEVNVIGQVAVTQAFLPLLRSAPGRIVNLGSVGDRITIPFGGALCGSKSAFASLNDALRLELRPFGIHVSLIEPGTISTRAVHKVKTEADRLLESLPAEGVQRYGDTYRRFVALGFEREQHGSPPEVVAGAVLHALTARRPKARYPVGKDARVLTTLPRLLPDGALDTVRLRIFGLPRAFGASRKPD